ncbi:VOC family protein [Streptomyces sp. 4N509B]|uniref:VOC family protein n=1 Tax=Streptomyces sp. 4N509B TaxID=3457413 RepID=UPI003FD36BB4
MSPHTGHPHAGHRHTGISHVEIGVSDAERSLDFYRGLLGLRPAADAPEPERPGVHWLDADGALLRLAQAPADSTLGGWVGDDLQRGMRHVGLKVGDVHRRSERLRDAGVTFSIEPTRAVGDVNLAFFRDPDGTLLEFIDGHLHYHHVHDQGLADRERSLAEARPADAGPVFDHVALTSDDLTATLALYRDTLGYPLIGRLDHTQDPRGFVIHYLQAGSGVLEVFTFTEPTTPAPTDPERLGLRAVALAAGDAPAGQERLADPDGVPLRLVTR